MLWISALALFQLLKVVSNDNDNDDDDDGDDDDDDDDDDDNNNNNNNIIISYIYSAGTLGMSYSIWPRMSVVLPAWNISKSVSEKKIDRAIARIIVLIKCSWWYWLWF